MNRVSKHRGSENLCCEDEDNFNFKRISSIVLFWNYKSVLKKLMSG